MTTFYKSDEILQKITSSSPHLSWLQGKTVFLTVHGSRAYGTNTETSDYDYKGVCIPTKNYYLGSQQKFEQAELKEPDTVIYEIRKFFNLAAATNPNIVEVLHTDPSDHLFVDPIGEIILDNKDKFLSKRVKHTFAGYAHSQLKRIKTHRRWILNPVLAPPTRAEMGLPEKTLIPQDQLLAAQAEVQKEIDRFQFDFMEELSNPMKIAVSNAMSEMLAELKITTDQHWMAAARKVGLNDNFIELMQKEREYNAKKKEFDQYQEWKVSRNKDRYLLEEKFGYDTKHAYHLVRLLRMCREILTTGKVIVKRPDREELIEIRNGSWDCDELIDFAEREDKALQLIYNECKILPKTPDFEYLDNLCIQLVEKSLSKYSWYNIKKRYL